MEAFIEAKNKDEVPLTTIRILGLNDNPFLNRQRKSIVDKTLLVRNKIMATDRTKMGLLLRQAIQFYSTPSKNHAPKLDEPDSEYFQASFWFVSLAVLKGNLKLIL